TVTGVQPCALPISVFSVAPRLAARRQTDDPVGPEAAPAGGTADPDPHHVLVEEKLVDAWRILESAKHPRRGDFARADRLRIGELGAARELETCVAAAFEVGRSILSGNREVVLVPHILGVSLRRT